VVSNMIPGGEVVRQLENSRRDARRRADEVRANLDKLDDFMKDLVERRGEVLVELAQHYLPDISSSTVANQFKEVRGHIEELLRRKQRHEAELQDQWDAMLDRRSGLDDQIEKVTGELDNLATKRDELENQLASRLRAQPEFQTLSEQALAAETELKRNELRVAEMRDEVAEKLPAYEKSKLFKYLHKRGYGTPEYNGKGLTKQLDGWVARIVKFHKNRQSYNFLKVTPELMAAEVERRRAEFTKLMERLEAIEDAISDEIGLTTLLKQGTELGDERQRLLGDVAKQETERARIEKQIAQLQATENEYYVEGVNRLRDFLGGMEESALAVRTRATPQTTDDEIFREIKRINEQLRSTREQSHEDRKLLEIWHDKVAGLDQVVLRFRSSEFDSRRSWFHTRLDVPREVDRYLEGNSSSSGLWATLREHQQFVRPEFDSGSGSWPDLGNVFDSDVSRVLGRVLIEVAGEALRQSAQRGMHRRGPSRQQSRQSSGKPPYRRGGGFTSGRGF
jgi:chromosome segregation ATPase